MRIRRLRGRIASGFEFPDSDKSDDVNQNKGIFSTCSSNTSQITPLPPSWRSQQNFFSVEGSGTMLYCTTASLSFWRKCHQPAPWWGFLVHLDYEIGVQLLEITPRSSTLANVFLIFMWIGREFSEFPWLTSEPPPTGALEIFEFLWPRDKWRTSSEKIKTPRCCALTRLFWAFLSTGWFARFSERFSEFSRPHDEAAYKSEEDPTKRCFNEGFLNTVSLQVSFFPGEIATKRCLGEGFLSFLSLQTSVFLAGVFWVFVNNL